MGNTFFKRGVRAAELYQKNADFINTLPSLYEFKQNSVAVPITDDLVAATIRNRSQATFDQMTKDLNTSIYGDKTPYFQPSTWQRHKFIIYRARISDAWGVLTGRLEVGSDW